MQTIDDYDMRCVGLSCKHSSRCQRHYSEKDMLMPWTPVAFNACQLLEQSQFLPFPPSTGEKAAAAPNPAPPAQQARR